MQVFKLPIKTILLIDDDEDDYMVFKIALAEAAPHVALKHKTTCENIAEVLATIKPDILFLDINLPRVNGIKCLELLQKSTVNNTVPIVVYSSSELPKDLISSYHLGATLYFHKPSNVNTLIQSLNSILKMNWHAPDVIKNQFFRDGKYSVYQEEPA